MRYLITSALPYINGTKHLGNLVGSMLPADVYARFLRQTGQEVLFICGTDEHGTPAELAALQAGVSAREYCDTQYKAHRAIYDRYCLSFDHFGRTSNPLNHSLTQAVYRDLQARGFIERRTSSQAYSAAEQRFLPDRYIVGECPRCSYAAARGDQCEQCGTVLDPHELVNPRSTVTGTDDITFRDTVHDFLRLDQLQPALEQWLKENDGVSGVVRAEAEKWLKEGLRPRAITRDLHWGIPVPGAEQGKVFYVWFDAPLGYVSATQEWALEQGRPDAWKRWWRAAEDVHYAQFMAKDNIVFHAVLFPAMLLGAGQASEPDDAWKLVDHIKAFQWLTYYGGKFSTSSRRGVFLDAAIDLFDADVWRYSLLAMAPETSDSSFTWGVFATHVNKDLADKLGNFVNRVCGLANKLYAARVPDPGPWTSRDEVLETEVRERINELQAAYAEVRFRRVTEILRELWSTGNRYIDETQPWKLSKTDPDRCARVLATALALVRTYAITAAPILPQTAERLAEALGFSMEETEQVWSGKDRLLALEAGRTFRVPPVLFGKIQSEELADLEKRFEPSESQA